ncbi:MAG: hypothetical protein ABUL64_03270 [Singulisphaera sp.]
MSSASRFSLDRTWIIAVMIVMAAFLATLISFGHLIIMVPFPYPEATPEELATARIQMAISAKLFLAARVTWLVAICAMAVCGVRHAIMKRWIPH